MTYNNYFLNRNYDATDLIVQLQKQQNKVQLDSTTPLTIYRYLQWGDLGVLSDTVRIAVDPRARYDTARYDTDTFV